MKKNKKMEYGTPKYVDSITGYFLVCFSIGMLFLIFFVDEYKQFGWFCYFFYLLIPLFFVVGITHILNSGKNKITLTDRELVVVLFKKKKMIPFTEVMSVSRGFEDVKVNLRDGQLVIDEGYFLSNEKLDQFIFDINKMIKSKYLDEEA